MKKNKNTIKTIFIASVVLLIFFSSLSPIFAQYKNQEKIPGLGNTPTSDFITYLKQIINFGFAIIGILALFMLIIGAYQYLLAAGSGKAEGAKETIASALLGLILGLTAWIILNKINPDLVKMNPISTISGGNNNSSGANNNSNNNNNNQPTTPPSPNAGKCVEGTGKCAESNMSCFGSQAKNASIVCNAESGGDIKAGGDKCGGTPVSYGLLQMNTSCHNLGLGCQNAFKRTDTGANCCIGTNGCNNSNCQVANSALASQCQAAMSDQTANLQAACNLYKTSGWQPWSGASKCGIS